LGPGATAAAAGPARDGAGDVADGPGDAGTNGKNCTE
jgi:hypothetical protein